MTTIATLAVRLIGDIREYTTAMNTAKTTAQQTATDISKSLKDVGGNITNMGKNATAFITLPLLGAGAAALTYASNMVETKSKASVVFDEMTADVMNWSLHSDTALGLSQQKALDAVSTFGAMGKTAGLSATDNLKWSESLVQLGSDWSSFYNLNPVDALNAIQSATAGQYEPLRRMGIVINQASVEQKALQMGLMEEGGVLSDAARYQALYAVMVEQSSDAQGDFARTADGVANQTRIVRAQFENAAATLGEQLLPIATQFLGWISKAITWFQQLNPEQQKWILIIGAIATGIGPVLIIVGSLVTAIGAIAGVVGAITAPILIAIGVIALIGVEIYLLYLAWENNWMNIQGVVQWVTTYISTIVKAWQAAFNGDWYQFGVLMRQAWDMVWTLIANAVGTAWTSIKTSLAKLINNAITFFTTTNWSQLGAAIIDGIVQGLSDNSQAVVDFLYDMMDNALDAIKGFLGIASPSKVFRDQIGRNMALGLQDGFRLQMKSSLLLDASNAMGSKGLSSAQLQGIEGGGGFEFNNYGRMYTRDATRLTGKDLQKMQRMT